MYIEFKDDNFVLDHATLCADWYRLWSTFGFTEYQWTSRAAKVAEYTQKVLSNKILTYKEQLYKREQFLQQTIEDYEDIIARTGLSSDIDDSILDHLKLRDQEMYLDDKMQDLLEHENQLIQQRNELETKEKSLCSLLNTSPIESNLPISLIELNEKLKDHIQMLNDLKNQRLAQVSSYYLKLKEYSEQLEWTPSSPQSTVEYLLLQQFDRCLTADCLNEIEITIHELEKQIEFQKEYFADLHEQLAQLYRRLNKDPIKDYCLAFKNGKDNLNAFVIKQLEHEIACCREERMKNGKEYCLHIRQQIADLIEQTHSNVHERVTLDKLDFEPLSPNLLDAYDAEYERISQLYRKRKSILDAYHKWLTFWNEFVAFTKASTDPGRFHIRGYNAEIEGRKRKKFQRDLPIIEQEFLVQLAEYDEPVFLYDNIPIRQLFDDAHRQIPMVNISATTPRKTPTVTSRLLGLTPIKTRTPIRTPHRMENKQPFLLGTAIANSARRAAKTPATNVARKLLHKITSRTEEQPIRAKPIIPPPPPPPVSLSSDDQSLDFSLLHTIKNVYGQTKIMTSTPNTSLIPTEHERFKTTRNIITQRKSKRHSKRTPLPLLTVHDTSDETLICL